MDNLVLFLQGKATGDYLLQKTVASPNVDVHQVRATI